MPSPAPRQTLSFLMRRFNEAGVRPKTKFGQNFLIDLNLLDVLIEAAELGPNDVVLEVGTGTGSLTTIMAPRVAKVVTVEIDDQMFQLASEELFHFSNVQMLQVDALAKKSRLADELLEAVDEALASIPNARFKLVANLPYNVATPLISNLLALDRPPEMMAVTIQKELADRIIASPSTKDYSALSVWVQSQCRAEIVRTLPPSAFWPRPKVTSAFLKIALEPELRGRISDRVFFQQFARSMFLHRRKYLRAQLLSAAHDVLDKPGVDELLAKLELDPTLRAEQLPVETFLKLSDALQAVGGA